jgi:hypothetical protein
MKPAVQKGGTKPPAKSVANPRRTRIDEVRKQEAQPAATERAA